MKNIKFQTIYWGSDNSTQVRFEPVTDAPDLEMVTSCFVFPIYKKNRVVMAHCPRGWGLPGGHREAGESPADCVRRELELVGRWVAKKKFNSPINKKYPDVAYQLLYVSRVKKLLAFQKSFETTDRSAVLLENVHKIHHNFKDFKDVFNHVVSLYNLKVPVA